MTNEMMKGYPPDEISQLNLGTKVKDEEREKIVGFLVNNLAEIQILRLNFLACRNEQGQ